MSIAKHPLLHFSSCSENLRAVCQTQLAHTAADICHCCLTVILVSNYKYL